MASAFVWWASSYKEYYLARLNGGSLLIRLRGEVDVRWVADESAIEMQSDLSTAI